jgi:FdhD protein
MQELDRRSELHRRTGGVHAAALASPSGILVFREDIGRHNAVDKAVGAWLGREGGFADKILLCSGRLSSEILSKALRCRIPVLVSRSAPTDRGVALARRFNLTLVGFARGRRLNIYSGAERIVSPQS